MVRHFVSDDGIRIAVGENAAQNQALVGAARQNDEWVHLAAGPSAHALVALTGVSPTPSPATVRAAVADAGQLVKHYSPAARGVAAVGIIHCAAKFVSKKGVEDAVGAVTLKKAPTTVVVVRNEEALARLLGSGGGKQGKKN
ncbi:hypothetical protein BU14_0200s0036 [Porphyra umbilicalis]|uniref:NFACT RNA-binding domain-containing protein n=1 Tax=Porphyra umbilicalis TaxID=2786 RepID=A0A1X6P5U9_PORUM|nr:hypothetical protein BU14_0200s0036 [Porphyra umbilicalis]|eukprot:OSX76281.1 hypothetical protein BU14_0200s0036 [Porphyra umbilicalis]